MSTKKGVSAETKYLAQRKPAQAVAFNKIAARLSAIEKRLPQAPAIAPRSLRPVMVKIGTDGKRVADSASDHVAVLLPDYGLMFDTAAPKLARDWAHAKDLGAACRVLGHKDWQLASDEELQLLIRRDRHAPAIDTSFFPHTPTSDWYWTRTPYASSPSGCAWCVHFSHGLVGWGRQYSGGGLVRACRRVPARQF